MLGFPKPRARVFGKIDAKHAAERRLRAVYAEVDARDGKRCRCCGRQGNPYATTALGRIHRHHVAYRSQGGEDTSANLVSLCERCHALCHGQQLHILGTDANAVLRFELHEAAVVDVFGSRELPTHVRIVVESRR